MFPKKTVLGEAEVNRVRVVVEENVDGKAEIGNFSVFSSVECRLSELLGL